ncbi:helix-turn-helix domain-containing protein [Candidatus Enterovibrio escicola]|uniref:helix-turn-helix domain-containing protein n=1 Tax=Candidatus Enterovibrio escicola TaxID=1927127 RepID=UPI0011BACBD2|nr:helix-turn-helix domain-containing protein [Candidatus Enterovibrio escacola]
MAEGYSFSQITRRLGCGHSTINRKIKCHIPNDFYGISCHLLASEEAKETSSNAMNGLFFGFISEKMKVLIHEHLSTHTLPEAN